MPLPKSDFRLPDPYQGVYESIEKLGVRAPIRNPTEAIEKRLNALNADYKKHDEWLEEFRAFKKSREQKAGKASDTTGEPEVHVGQELSEQDIQINEDMGGSPLQSTGLRSEADVPWNEETSDSTLQSSSSRSEQEVDGQWPEASIGNGLERTWELPLAVTSIKPQ